MNMCLRFNGHILFTASKFMAVSQKIYKSRSIAASRLTLVVDLLREGAWKVERERTPAEIAGLAIEQICTGESDQRRVAASALQARKWSYKRVSGKG
jgi:hypothetical protein